MEICFDKYTEDNKVQLMNCEEFYGFHVQGYVATIKVPLMRGVSVTKILNFRGRILCVQKSMQIFIAREFLSPVLELDP